MKVTLESIIEYIWYTIKHEKNFYKCFPSKGRCLVAINFRCWFPFDAAVFNLVQICPSKFYLKKKKKFSQQKLDLKILDHYAN